MFPLPFGEGQHTTVGVNRPAELDAFVTESRKVGGAAHIVDLLCIDAGLRLGEATALRWEDCSFGRNAADTARSS